MKILHTSDFHLIKVDDNRWQALLKVMELAKRENIQLLVISGDLFDKSSDAESLKSEIRDLFSGNSFKIALIPGNHDYRAFNKGVFFGKDVVYRENTDAPAISIENVDIWELPFEPIGETEVLKKLKIISKRLNRKKINILLFHGELLDSFYSGGDYGEEGESTYMPVRLSYLENLGFQYILAGHFHKNFEIKNLNENGYFVYSGSPVSITKREIGKRAVNLIEVGSPPEQYKIDTYHYEYIEVNLNPVEHTDPLSIIMDKIKDIDSSSRLILKVKGYINSKITGYDEKMFYEKVEESLPDAIEYKAIEVNDISGIVNDDLYKEFSEYIKDLDIDVKSKEELNDLVINAFVKLK